jgi:hypothetical protein
LLIVFVDLLPRSFYWKLLQSEIDEIYLLLERVWRSGYLLNAGV